LCVGKAEYNGQVGPYKLDEMKKAIVIGCHVNGLGVIRSLGLKGSQIIAMSYDGTDFGHTSKYVYERVKIPHLRIQERILLTFELGILIN
jgi:hypothetical protein